MNTQQRTNSYTGPLLVLFTIWLLFLGGLDVVRTWTQRMAQPPQIMIAPGSLGGPASNAIATPIPSGELAPLTLDGQPQPAPDVPAQVIQPEQAAPIVSQAEQPAVPAQVQPQPTTAPMPAPAAPVLPTALVAQPQPQQRVAVQDLPRAILPTATPPLPTYPPRPQPGEYAIASTSDRYGNRIDCVQQNGQQVCQPPNIAMTDKDAQDILILLRAGAIKGEPVK